MAKSLNIMKVIATMLGVKIGEEFHIEYENGVISHYTYKFTEDNFVVVLPYREMTNGMVIKLLAGKCTITKRSPSSQYTDL